jgi:3-deoxy-7-phosphoheptulonate synthase
LTATLKDGLRRAAWDSRKPRKTVVAVGSMRIGEGFTICAGLAGESDKSIVFAAARAVREAGADILRWGVFMTSLGHDRSGTADAERFAILREIGSRTGMPALIEVTDTKDVSMVAGSADILMVGAPNMQNFSLLKELGRSAKKPVLLMRGWHATLKEWLNSAEYILSEGNPEVLLCEGGIRSFEGGSRFILDLSAVPALKRITHLPVLVDVSRAGGAEEIEKMGLAAVAAGADGIMVDVFIVPDESGSMTRKNGIILETFAAVAPKITAMRSLLEGLRDDHP